MVHTKYVVITRTIKNNTVFKEELEQLGFPVLEYPCIATAVILPDKHIQKMLLQLHTYDWVIFTSLAGMEAFMECCSKLQIDTSVLKTKKIAAIGTKTAEGVQEYGFTVSFVPKRFTARDLASEIGTVVGKKILLPRSEIAIADLEEALRQRGAIVTNTAVYKTVYTSPDYKLLKMLVSEGKIGYSTFTSVSTVRGFIRSIRDTDILEKLKYIPTIAIGPITKSALEKERFTQISTADPHTIDGIIQVLTNV